MSAKQTKTRAESPHNIALVALCFGLALFVLAAQRTTAQEIRLAEDAEPPRIELAPGESNWEPVEARGPLSACLVTTDFSATTPAIAVTTLLAPVPPGTVIGGQVFRGALRAGGTFSNGTIIEPRNPIGIPSGVILSTGDIAGVKGLVFPPFVQTNGRDDTSSNNAQPGDATLNPLCSPSNTMDRAALEFNITHPTQAMILSCKFVFTSEEYNSWVPAPYDDVAGMFVTGPGLSANLFVIPNASIDGTVCGGPPGLALCIDNINRTFLPPDGGAPNAGCYVTNDCYNAPPDAGFPCAPPQPPRGGWPPIPPGIGGRYTEMDGVTRVLQRGVFLNAGDQYNVKIAIADQTDRAWDSNIFVKCSLGSGACTFTTGFEWCQDAHNSAPCTAAGGTYYDGQLCENLPLAPLTGQCCLPNNQAAVPAPLVPTCTELTSAECTALGGTYGGNGTLCGNFGACTGLGSPVACVETTQTCCTLPGVGGTYPGDGSLCPGTVIAQGACCTLNGACSVKTPGECAPSTYVGDGTTCQGDANNNGIDDVCDEINITPAVSNWGFLVMGVLVLTAATLAIRGRRAKLNAA